MPWNTVDRHKDAQIAMARRRAFVLELIAADGTMPWPRVAEAVIAAGLAPSDRYGATAVRKDFRIALTQFTDRETIRRARSVQHLRLTRLMRAKWPKAIEGDDRAIEVIVKLMQREAQLLGLDAPNRTALEISMHIEELSNAAVAAVAYALDKAELEPEAQQAVLDGIRQYLHREDATVFELEAVPVGDDVG